MFLVRFPRGKLLRRRNRSWSRDTASSEDTRDAFLSVVYESAEQVRNRNARPPCQFMNARRGASRVLHRSALGIITFECAVGIQRHYKSKRVRDTSAIAEFVTVVKA